MSRLLKNQDDIMYYLQKETGQKKEVIDEVINNFWKSFARYMTKEVKDIERIILTSFLTFDMTYSKYLKFVSNRMEIMEEMYKKYPNRELNIRNLDYATKKYNETIERYEKRKAIQHERPVIEESE